MASIASKWFGSCTAKQPLILPVIDANAYIGDRAAASAPSAYLYDNQSLKILISRPTKTSAKMPGIVLASPRGLNRTPIEHFAWFGKAMSGCYQAVVFNVEYRPGVPDHPLPAGLLDLLAALKYMVAMADAYSIDTSRIAIAGQSSGCTVMSPLGLELAARGEASLVKLIFMESPLMFPDVLAPNETMSAWHRYILEVVIKEQYVAYAGGPSKWEARLKDKDPLLHVMDASDDLLSKMPQHIIVTSEFDDFRDVNEAYATKLMKCGVLKDVVIAPGKCPH